MAALAMSVPQSPTSNIYQTIPTCLRSVRFQKVTQFPVWINGAQLDDPTLLLQGRTTGKSIEEALDSVEKNGGKLDAITYNSLLSNCISQKALQEGIRLHSHMVSIGFELGIFLENQFINLYAKCGRMDSACQVFEKMPQRNLVSWNVMIAGYCQNKCYVEALDFFRVMNEKGIMPNQFTYASALRACGRLGNASHGDQIHAHAIKLGCFSHLPVGNALISLYAKLGNLEDAETVFCNLFQRDEVSWNAIIAANAQSGCDDRALVLFKAMQEQGFGPNQFTFGSVLRSCANSRDIDAAKELHAQIIKTGFETHLIVGSALLDVYAKCRNLRAARVVFDKMPDRNTVSWNTMVAGFIENDQTDEGLQLLLQMCNAGFCPDGFTISSLLKATAIKSNMEEGKQLHAFSIKAGLNVDASVGNALITMYSKHGKVFNSHMVFREISIPDLISWNAMIQSYVENNQSEQGLVYFMEMKDLGIEPDEFSFVSLLMACTSLAQPKTGREIHGNLIKLGLGFDSFVGTALVDMYAKSGATLDAKQVFDKIKQRDLITWNSMIVGLAQNGHGDQALKHIFLMREENIEPDNFTFAAILAACADIPAAQQGRQVHAQILKSRLIMDVAVANALITMYTRIGSINEAEQVFYKITDKNLVSWTAMIGGYAQNGYAKEALKLFSQMERLKMKPSGVTFVAVLTACSHAGLMDEAERYFNSMATEHGIEPGFEHYACMVDILGRAGRLREAEEFINRIPHEPNALVWRMLLAACRTHRDLDRGKRSMEKILALEPGDSAAYVLLSNIHAGLGNWEGVAEVRRLMRENGVKKEPGKSWIEVRNRIHEFVAGDLSHPQSNQIYSRLRELLEEMKKAGYVPDADWALRDMEKKKKEDLICYHSEKLAIALGLINLAPGVTVKVFKNLRICGDCHNAAKFISKIVKREVIVRDATRFHHFRDGVCSCADYW